MDSFLKEETATIEELLPSIARLLTSLCRINDAKKRVEERSLTMFDCQKVPEISISAYLERLCKQGKCTPSCLIVMVIYIDRLLKMSRIAVNSQNVHRILLGAFVLATKNYSDEFYTNKYYGTVGGVKDMNSLEAAFLYYIDWKLQVDAEYPLYCQQLQKRCVPVDA